MCWGAAVRMRLRLFDFLQYALVFFTWTEIVYYEISSCVFLSPILIHSLSLAARLIFRSLIAFKAAQPTSSIHTKVPITAFWSSTGSEKRGAWVRGICTAPPSQRHMIRTDTHIHVCAHPLRAKTIIIMEATVDSFMSTVSTAASRALCLVGLRARATGGRAGTSFPKKIPAAQSLWPPLPFFLDPGAVTLIFFKPSCNI
jgi:hypothetical protein